MVSEKQLKRSIRREIIKTVGSKISLADRRILGHRYFNAMIIVFNPAGAIKRLSGLWMTRHKFYGIKEQLRIAENCKQIIEEIKNKSRYVQTRYRVHHYRIPSPRRIIHAFETIAKRHVQLAFKINKDVCFRMLTRENGLDQYRRFCILRGQFYQH